MSEEVLRITPEGKFIWHENAKELIETGDFSDNPAMKHILTRLYTVEGLVEALELSDKVLRTWMPVSWDRKEMDKYTDCLNKNKAALQAYKEANK